MAFDRTVHCRKLSESRRLQQSDVISKFREVHGDRYDYTLVDYVNANTHVQITCKDHGVFMQTPSMHRSGQGCPKCGEQKRNKTLRMNSEDYFEQCTKVHNGRFEYDTSSYVNMRSPIKVKCPEHGWFYPNARHHKNGVDCPACNNESRKYYLRCDKTSFVEKSSGIHGDRYDYSKVVYDGNKTKVVIDCPNHGSFHQTPNDHLDGHGCPKCASNGPSDMANDWLTYVGIPHDDQHREVGGLLENRRYTVDGYDPETNTVYEFHGDYWHGNPDLYESDVMVREGVTFGDLYQQTINRRDEFRRGGYTVIEMWERDWLTNRTPHVFLPMM